MFNTYVLSVALVEEVFQQLAREPYANVAVLIGKLQAELQHQPASPPDTPPPEVAHYDHVIPLPKKTISK